MSRSFPCRRCGEPLAVPDEALRDPAASLVCPGCGLRYARKTPGSTRPVGREAEPAPGEPEPTARPVARSPVPEPAGEPSASPPTSAPATAPGAGGPALGAHLLAAYQRFVLWYCVQLVLLLFSRLTLPSATWSPTAAALYLVTMVGALLTVAGVVLSGYRVAVKTGSDTGWAWALALLVPLLSLPAFVLLGRLAARAGRAAGLPFGLLGLPKRPRG